MSPSARWLVVAVSIVVAPAIGRAASDTDQAAAGHKLTLRLATGVAYLHESRSPNDGNPGSVQSGWAPALEVAVGRVLGPQLVVGGIWQIASVFSPTESFAGTDYHLVQVVKLSNLAGVYVEDPRLPRVPLRAGIALGLLGSSFYDRAQGEIDTTFALAASPYLGYDRRLSRRWSVGALARLTLYRSLFGDTPASATTTGVLPSLMVAFAILDGRR